MPISFASADLRARYAALLDSSADNTLSPELLNANGAPGTASIGETDSQTVVTDPTGDTPGSMSSLLTSDLASAAQLTNLSSILAIRV